MHQYCSFLTVIRRAGVQLRKWHQVWLERDARWIAFHRCHRMCLQRFHCMELWLREGSSSDQAQPQACTGFPQKSENRIPWLICFFPWLPFSHGFRYGYDCVSQHARQSQTGKLTQPWEQAIPWLFHDFLGNFHIPRLFHDFPWHQFFPGFSMTVGTLLHLGTLPCKFLQFFYSWSDLLGRWRLCFHNVWKTSAKKMFTY